MRATRRSEVVASLVILLAIGTIGPASAYWRGTGGGAGSGGTGSTQPVTLSPATVSTQIYPGGQAAVAVLVTNPNPGPVRVGSLSLDTAQGVGGFAVDGAHTACGVGTLSYATQSNGGSGWTIAGAGSSTLTFPSALTMGSGASSACQGASFTVYLKVTP